MEKVMYHVWKEETVERDSFRDRLVGELVEKLPELGVKASRAAVYDDYIDKGQSVRVKATRSQPDAVLSVWLDSANDYFRASVDAVVEELSTRMHAYLVTESEPITNVKYPEVTGQRVEGMNQIVFLRKPDRLAYNEWLSIWHNSHSFVGIGTQSTFAYRQNVVARPLTYAAPHYDAFIEECFPEQSINDPSHYYDDQGEKSAEWDDLIDAYFPRAVEIRRDPELQSRWEINNRIMIESCLRFIDMGQDPFFTPKIDCIPYSEYILSQGPAQSF